MSGCGGRSTLLGSAEGNLAIVQGEREKEPLLRARSVFQTKQEHLLVLPRALCVGPR